jgi:hypothetical protein
MSNLGDLSQNLAPGMNPENPEKKAPHLLTFLVNGLK